MYLNLALALVFGLAYYFVISEAHSLIEVARLSLTH